MKDEYAGRSSFILINAVVPILIGIVLYFIVAPEVLFIRGFDTQGVNSGLFERISTEYVLLREIRYYLPDMLWAYSLVFALYIACGQEKTGLLSVFILAACFTAALECSQISTLIPGTFDLVDIVVELAAELLAFFIIRKKGERVCYEDQKSYRDLSVSDAFCDDVDRERIVDFREQEGHYNFGRTTGNGRRQ